MIEAYGLSTFIDLSRCASETFTRTSIEAFMVELCKQIDMEREDLHFWDYEGDPAGYEAAPPHLRGVSAVQFIKTSTIVIHTLDTLRAVFIDLFSCKDYEPDLLKELAERWFRGEVINMNTHARTYICSE